MGTHGIQGFPTIKWGDPSALEAYEGGRTYKELKKFAMENIKPMCSPSNLDLCDEEKKKAITDLQSMLDDELQEKIAEKEKILKDTEAKFKGAVEELQAKYEQLEKDKTKKISDVKSSGLGLMKAVQAAKKKGKDEL